MQINTQNWDVPQKREFGGDIAASGNPVFVQGPFGDQSSFPNYEYSGDAPARLRRTIDNLLEGPYHRQNFINLFYCLPEIAAPVHEIASRVADAAWQLRSDRTDEVITTDKDFNRLFSNPNPLMSFKQLCYQAVCYEILTGCSLSTINIPSTLPRWYTNIITWTNIPSQSCTPIKKKNVDPYTATSIEDYIEGYQTGDGRKFDPKKVINISNYDLISGNKIDGYTSQLIGAKLAIRNLLPVYEARGVIYIKRGALGFIVSKKSDESGLVSLTPKEKDQAQNEFQGTYGLRSGQNQIGVVSAPVEFVKTAMSIQELQPFDETLADALAIYACLRVPRHLCPTKDASTFSNAGADMKSFYEDTIIPTANRYAETWTNEFAIPNRKIYADFSNVGILQENKKEKASVDQINGNMYLQRFVSGVGTLNDWRVSNGEKPDTNAMYNKLIFNMDPTELDLVEKIINLKAASSGKSAGANSVEEPKIV